MRHDARSVRKVVHSRCYVNFEDPSDIPAFKAAVEAHAFVTDRGAQFRGSVEYAPFQKVPQGKPKRDPREGTFDKGWSTHLVPVPSVMSRVLTSLHTRHR